jgi:hypothetical protein
MVRDTGYNQCRVPVREAGHGVGYQEAYHQRALIGAVCDTI